MHTLCKGVSEASPRITSAKDIISGQFTNDTPSTGSILWFAGRVVDIQMYDDGSVSR